MPRRVRRHLSLVLCGWALLALPSPAAGQAALPGSGATVPGTGARPGTTIDQLERSVTRPPAPVPPPPAIPSPDQVWVPDRWVNVPGVAGHVHVPGHWERRLSDREHYVPPLTGVGPDGTIVQFPAGVAPKPEERRAP